MQRPPLVWGRHLRPVAAGRGSARWMLTVISLLLILMMISAGALADTAADDWLTKLPSGDADTARAIAAHLNGQWDIINGDQTARDMREYADIALAESEKAKAAADTALQDVQAALGLAQTEADDAQSVQENLQAARAALTAYESARLANNLAIKSEESSSAALDKAEDDLLAAQALLEEADSDWREQAAAFDQAEERVAALRESAQQHQPGESAALKTAEADLASAERTHEAFAAQVALYAEQATHARQAARQAQTTFDKAFDAEQIALQRIEDTSSALTTARTAYESLQATDGDLAAHELEAAKAALRTQAALDAAQALIAQSTDAVAQRATDLAESQARHAAALEAESAAAGQLAVLRSQWENYSACMGAVLDTYPMPAMDLLAREEAAPQLYAVYLNDTRLYLFRPIDAEAREGSREPFLSTVVRDRKIALELTRNANGTMSVRYVSSDGKTRLQSLGEDASALITGTIPMLAVDSQLRGMTQYLGEAASVNTTSMHGLTTLVHFGLDDPIRHEARPQ